MRHYLDYTLEELGPELDICLEMVVGVDADPGEPMVMYDRNGDGYPGSPPTIEITDVRVSSYTTETYALNRSESNEEIFKLIDIFTLDLLTREHYDDVEERVFEELSEV